MLEVEGGSDTECMRIFRHEAGHALDTAFRLHFRRRHGGSCLVRSPSVTRISTNQNPRAARYVLHLPAWYAQAHPAEDFAETFAVWLTPRSRWRRRYKGWPALNKLEYIDELMNELAGTKPRNRTRTKVEPMSEIRTTLREHYRRKREKYDFDWPAVYDRDLYRFFRRSTAQVAPERGEFSFAACVERSVR